jgi:hypothetical protein
MAREESFFDELARGLADGSVTRAKALRLMGAALLGGTLASVGMGEAAAAPGGCKRNGKKCKKSSQCCSETCVDGVCQNGEVCQGELVTPVGGGDPICACTGHCVASCDDCPSGTICATGSGECADPLPFSCTTLC